MVFAPERLCSWFDIRCLEIACLQSSRSQGLHCWSWFNGLPLVLYIQQLVEVSSPYLTDLLRVCDYLLVGIHDVDVVSCVQCPLVSRFG